MKTKKKHFKIFKKAVRYYCKKYHVTSWHIYFAHTDIDDAIAQLNAVAETRLAQFYFTKNWPDHSGKLNEKNIYRVAKHEVAHLILWPLYAAGWYRFTPEGVLESVNEEVTTLVAKSLK